jgi:hypothetical protein
MMSACTGDVFANRLLAAWHIWTPCSYNVFALLKVPNSLKNKGNPHEIDVKATREKCDLVRCSAWFGDDTFGQQVAEAQLDPLCQRHLVQLVPHEEILERVVTAGAPE